MSEPLRGRLLVAAPMLQDPNFARSVVLMLEHAEQGALGLVLNRPTQTRLAETVPQWAELAAEPGVVFLGGPVEPSAAICLAELAPGAEPDGFQRLAGRLGVLDLSADPALLGGAVARLRVFAGYAGWAAEQLDAELMLGGWHVLDAAPQDPFSGVPATLWSAVFRRQPGRLRLLAHFPPDPRLN